MRQLVFPLLVLVLASAPAFGQAPDSTAGRCASPDSIAVRGNHRISDVSILTDAALTPHTQLNYRQIQGAIHTLFATGQFSDVRVLCTLDSAANRATLTIAVKERPILGDIAVTGVHDVSDRSVKDRVDLLIGRPIDPAQVARAVERIDSLYESSGYYLATVRPETTQVNGKTKLTFVIDEGRRLAVSGIEIDGNRKLTDAQIVAAMKLRPEGFWWFRNGEFDEDKFAGDLGDRIPALYQSRGFLDFQVLHDTLIVDKDAGKALVRIDVSEGPQYKVGSFEVVGNRRFSTDDIQRYYPFAKENATLSDQLLQRIRGSGAPTGVFDEAKWDDATQKLHTAYNNEGYIYASIRPVVDREVVGPDSTHIVNLRWEIDEKQPAIIDHVEIAGNDYTSESCIRDQLVILPGDVFSQDRLVQSYRNIANMGFFDTPLAPPDTRPAGDNGDVDIIFHVKEKRTGNVNFGASFGQGTGLGGFIGLDQPNLFGLCKRGSLQWQFGQYINDFNLSYTDPAILQSRLSGTATVYNSQSRFYIANLGRSTRTGAQLQLGFPVPNSPYTRMFVSYGGESVRYGSGGLLGEVAGECKHCFRSTMGLTGTHDTRYDLPFPSGGSMQSVDAQFTGGPLGGTAAFQRYTGEIRSYATLGQVGGSKPGSEPVKFVLGLKARAGALFGNPGPFFYSQQFALGGVQFGEQLRGYEEFSITPNGVLANTSTYQAQLQSFGNAFFTSTAEVGVRFNSMFYLDAFMDAGNLWAHPRDFDPTRLYRGAGIGLSTVTPLGPLGLDWAYGFDRVDQFGNPAPKWQLHFRLGQLF